MREVTNVDIGLNERMERATIKSQLIEELWKEIDAEISTLPKSAQEGIKKEMDIFEKKNSYNFPSDLEAAKDMLLRGLDDDTLKDIPVDRKNMLEARGLMEDLIATKAAKMDRKFRETHEKSTKVKRESQEREQRAEELRKKIEKYFNSIASKNDESVFERAGQSQTDKVATIQKIIEETIAEYNAEKLEKSGGAFDMSSKDEGEEMEEIDLIADKVADKVVEFYQKFLYPPSESEVGDVLKESIDQLDLSSTSRSKLREQWEKSIDDLPKNIEESFRSHIKIETGAQISDYYKEGLKPGLFRIEIPKEVKVDEASGLLHIDAHSEPQTEDIQIQRFPEQKPTKKPGFLKRIFG